MNQEIERLASIAIECALAVHIDVGPGLLKSVYEALLAQKLRQAGLNVQTQLPVRAILHNLEFENAFRADMFINNILLIEIKAVEKLAPIHTRQILTYLRLLKLPRGAPYEFRR